MTHATVRPASAVSAKPGLQAAFDLHQAEVTIAPRSCGSSADQAPAPRQTDLVDVPHIDPQQHRQFDPRGWAVHLTMLAGPGMLTGDALARVKQAHRAATRSLREKTRRFPKPAAATARGDRA